MKCAVRSGMGSIVGFMLERSPMCARSQTMHTKLLQIPTVHQVKQWRLGQHVRRGSMWCALDLAPCVVRLIALAGLDLQFFCPFFTPLTAI